jgi:glycosyltransferase involved in cell wall biosynthesis
MKIAFLTSHINHSTQWNWFSDELQKRGVPHIHIIINHDYPLLADDLKAMGVKVYFLKHRNFFHFFTNFFQVCYILLKHKIDLVHTELPYGNLVGQISAWFCGIKMRVSTCGNTTWAYDFKNKKQLIIDKITYRLSKKVIALTEEAKEFLIENYNIPEEKLTIIHHSLKSDEYLFTDESRVNKLRAELNIEPGVFVIGMVARFEFWKGHIFAIEAFRKLLKEYPNVRLLIFGSKGESFDSVIRYIKSYDLQDYIMYKGFVSDNIALFRLFDVHIHIPIKSISETFGINIVEGMISGCAQILTLAGISCFTARNEENCLVVPYTSSNAVYFALKRMINDPELRARLGKQAQLDAIKYFKYSDKVEKHLELYESLRRELGK